ncbi:hypothetical protein ACJX0J_013998 [Zea mays]
MFLAGTIAVPLAVRDFLILSVLLIFESMVLRIVEGVEQDDGEPKMAGIDPDDVYSEREYIATFNEDEVAKWSGQEWELYIENLPADFDRYNFQAWKGTELVASSMAMIVKIVVRL